jgi:hypothetical protein
MNRRDEYLLNEEVKKLLREKGIVSEEAVIIGYRLGHKYIDNGITDALPMIIEKIAEAGDLKYRTVSSMVHKARPIKETQYVQEKKTVAKENPTISVEEDFTWKPFQELLADYYKK